MSWYSLCLNKTTFVFTSAWQRTIVKAKRIIQHFSIGALKEQRNGWILSLLSYLFDLLLLPEIIDLIWQIIKPNTRQLNSTELEEVKCVFGDSLPYDQIRIDEQSMIAKIGALLKKSPQMGLVMFYTVNFTRKIDAYPASRDMGWLVHELVHVSQMHYIGSRYIWEAIYAQQTAEGYNYGASNNLFGKQLHQFNREQQGEIARHYYEYVLYSKNAPHLRTYFQSQHYQSYINDLQQGKL